MFAILFCLVLYACFIAFAGQGMMLINQHVKNAVYRLFLQACHVWAMILAGFGAVMIHGMIST